MKILLNPATNKLLSVNGNLIQSSASGKVLKSNNKLISMKGDRLPSEYQEVEYIEGDGNQYIMSGVIPTQNHGFEAKIQLKGFYSPQQDDRAISVSQWSSGSNCARWGLQIRWSNSYWQIGGLCYASYQDVAQCNLNQDYVIQYNHDNQSKCYIDGVLKATMIRGTFTLPELPIMAFSLNGEPRFQFIGRFYYYKLYENATLIRNYIPCYRKSDSVIGLYDLVNNQFYTNAGSGSFAKGSDVLYEDKLVKEAAIIIDSTLSNNSWATIKYAIDNGLAPSGWLGQTKEIESGTYQGYHLQLVDLQSNRYQKSDNSGYTNAVFQFVECLTTTYGMNTSATNNGGWASCTLRTTMNTTFLQGLPQAIQNIISECKVKSGTGNNSTSGTSSSSNKLFLPCEWEMFGAKTYGIGSSEGTPQYQWYNTASRRIKYIYGTTTKPWWRLRSPWSGTNAQFCVVDETGGPNASTASDGNGIAPCFSI